MKNCIVVRNKINMIYYTNWTKKEREREKKTKRNEIFNVILVLGIYRNNIKGKLNEKNN